MIEIYAVNLFVFILSVISLAVYYTKLRWKNSDAMLKLAGIQLGLQAVFAAILYLPMVNSASDVEILNGQVESKYKDSVSCSHSYSCRCVTKPKGGRTCSTCYEHSRDYDWVVKTTVGNIRIDRVDRQGTREPERFSRVVIGEPASVEHTYTNYVKIDPESIFHEREQVTAAYAVYPNYPMVMDYYRINRVVPVGKGIDPKFVSELNQKLNASFRTVGPKKQANVVVIVGNTFTQDYMRALEMKWYAGKKNDTVVVINQQSGIIETAYVFGWSKSSIGNLSIRDSLIGKPLTVDLVHDTIVSGINTHFVRRDIKEFKYLLDQAHVPFWYMFVGLLMLLLSHIFIHIKLEL